MSVEFRARTPVTYGQATAPARTGAAPVSRVRTAKKACKARYAAIKALDSVRRNARSEWEHSRRQAGLTESDPVPVPPWIELPTEQSDHSDVPADG